MCFAQSFSRWLPMPSTPDAFHRLSFRRATYTDSGSMGVNWNSSAGVMGVIRGLLVLVGALHCLAKAVLMTSAFSRDETCIVVPDEKGVIWSSEEKPQTDLIDFAFNFAISFQSPLLRSDPWTSFCFQGPRVRILLMRIGRFDPLALRTSFSFLFFFFAKGSVERS